MHGLGLLGWLPPTGPASYIHSLLGDLASQGILYDAMKPICSVLVPDDLVATSVTRRSGSFGPIRRLLKLCWSLPGRVAIPVGLSLLLKDIVPAFTLPAGISTVHRLLSLMLVCIHNAVYVQLAVNR